VRHTHYSPALPRDHVRRLYFAAKARRIPMTRLVAQLVDEGLERMEPPAPAPGSHVEDAPAAAAADA
jgi:hypothetical protein